MTETKIPVIGKCNHGIAFHDYCRACEIVWLRESYTNAVRTVAKVRDRLRVLGEPMFAESLEAAS